MPSALVGSSNYTNKMKLSVQSALTGIYLKVANRFEICLNNKRITKKRREKIQINQEHVILQRLLLLEQQQVVRHTLQPLVHVLQLD